MKNRLLALFFLASSCLASAAILTTPLTRRNLRPMSAQKAWVQEMARKKFAARIKSIGRALGDSLGRWFRQKYGVPAGPGVVDEQTAIANFKTEVEIVGKWIEEKQKTGAADPAAGMAMVGEIVAKIKGIKTDGLPADLKGAWGEMNAILGEMGDIFKGLPRMDPATPDEAMKALGELMPKMLAIQAKVEPISTKLEEVGKKYGLDMTKVAPGNK